LPARQQLFSTTRRHPDTPCRRKGSFKRKGTVAQFWRDRAGKLYGTLRAEGQIGAALLHSPDRLSRTYAYQVLLTEEFSRCGVELIFV